MKRLISIAAALALLMAVLILPAYAENVDMSRRGSITATMAFNGEPVPGGTLTLYRVASLHPFEEDMFHYTAEFAESGVSLDVLDFDTAVELATYVYYNQIQGLTQTIGEDGVVKFEDLDVGLYLLIQWDPVEGYYELSPFLISIPNNENGVYVYDTESAPKQTPDERPTEPPTEEPPTEPPTDEPPTEPSTEPSTDEPSTEPPTDRPTEPPVEPPTEPDKPNLPQTGLTNWPIPILAVCGMFSLTAGLVMVIKGRKANDES